MTRDDIIAMAREAGSIDSEEVIETVWNAFSAALKAALAEPDWQDLYLKEKQRADMWRDKYESVAGAEQRIHPQAEPVQCSNTFGCRCPKHYTAPPQRPAEPVQEPVAKCIDDICSEHLGRVETLDYLPRGTILFTTPPQRKPLTDEQKQAIHNETGAGHSLICLVESYINGIKE